MTFRDAEERYFDRMHAAYFTDDDDDEETLSPKEIEDAKEQAAYERWKDRRDDQNCG